MVTQDLQVPLDQKEEWEGQEKGEPMDKWVHLVRQETQEYQDHQDQLIIYNLQKESPVHQEKMELKEQMVKLVQEDTQATQDQLVNKAHQAHQDQLEK